MSRLLIFVYGVISYVIGLGGLVYFILFLGNWEFMPFHINSRVPGPLIPALLINTGLMLLFGLQHSVTARPGFKKKLTRILPAAAERSTYVLLSGIILGLFCHYWQPIPGTLWLVDTEPAKTLLIGLYLFGWLLAVVATFCINHFELFGLQQVYLNFVQKPEPAASFTSRFLYKVVRHPLQLGVLIGVWFTPVMTTTHLMLAGMMTIYIFIGLYYEEKDLAAALGDDYREYQQRVHMILPIPKRNQSRS